MFHEPATAALPRVVVFLVALVLVAAAAWTAGRVSSPPIPVPDLPRPAVLGGHGGDGAGSAPAPVVPLHGHPG